MTRLRVSKADKQRDLERRARDCTVSMKTVREARQLIDRWQWTNEVETRLTAGTGRRRHLSWRAFLTLMVVHGLRTRESMVMTEVVLTALAMSAAQREVAGLPTKLQYHHVEGNFTDLHRAFSETVNRETGEIIPARLPYSIDQLIADLLQATAPGFLPQSDTLAADGTAIESFYRRRSRSHNGQPDIADGQLPVADKDTAPMARTAGWPLRGHDGRLQHTVDPDAREGYRSPKDGQSTIYLGYEPTTVADVPGIGQESRYPIIRAIALRPAGADRSEACLAAIDALPHPPTELIVDRGYSYLKDFGAGLVGRGVGMVADLHQNQRTITPGPKPHTIWIDGTLFTDAVAKDQRSLGGFMMGWPQQQRLEHAARYDHRAAFAFTPMGKPDPKTGKLRFRGPALTGRVRCRNNPRSMRLKATPKRPTTNCIAKQPCGCSATMVLTPEQYARTHQTEIYGTTKWLASYGRRVAIESSNAELRSNRLRITKQSFRVRGKNAIALLFGILAAVANIVGLSDWYNHDWLDLVALPNELPKFERKPPQQEATHRLTGRSAVQQE